MSTCNLYRPVSKLFNGFDNHGCLALYYGTLQRHIYRLVSELLYGFNQNDRFASYCATSARPYKNWNFMKAFSRGFLY